MSQQAPKFIDPDSKWFVVRSPDNEGPVVGKFETNAPVKIPEDVGDFVVVGLSDKQALDDYTYGHENGFL